MQSPDDAIVIEESKINPQQEFVRERNVENGQTLSEELERVQHELRQQVLLKSRKTDSTGLFNLDVSAMVTFNQAQDVEQGDSVNRIKNTLRSCFSNEIKSAKELKIYLKGESPLFFPTVVFNSNPMLSPSQLDLRTKLPARNGQIQANNGQPNVNLAEQGFITGYCDDLDRWLLTHQPIFEEPMTSRGVCRLYCIFISETMNRFVINASTGFLSKIKDHKFIISTLSVIQCNPQHSEFYLEKPLIMASFGNLDLLKPIHNILTEITKSGQITREKVKNQLLGDFFRCMMKVKTCKAGIEARKDWLIANSRCSEILDSEFYYQMLPSLDMCLFEISDAWLKDRQIKALKMMKPDWRYLNCATIGFSCPRKLDTKEWRAKYGQSRGVGKDEGQTISQHKLLSIGKVKSYGSITCIQNSAGIGAQGSPVFNELGKCWGFLLRSYNDVPPKANDEVQVPDPLKMPGGAKAAEIPLTSKEQKKKKRKDKKREKKRKDKEKKKKSKQSKKDNKDAKKQDAASDEEKDDLHPLEMPRVESEDTDSRGGSVEDQNPVPNIEDNNILGDSYFDVKSDHCLQPLLPQQNSYNRNMVLTMGHSGVKYIIEKVSSSIEQVSRVREVRDKIMQRKPIECKQAPVTIDQGLLDDAQRVGRHGMLTSMVLYDMNKQEAKEMAQRNLLEYRVGPEKADARENKTCLLMQDNEAENSTTAASDSPGHKQQSVRVVKKGGNVTKEIINEVDLKTVEKIISKHD